MESFKFDGGIVTLDIEGKVFDVAMNSEFSRRMREYSVECKERAERIKSGDEEDVTGFLCEIIDALIGEGASDAILGGRVPDAYELGDILIYICDAYEEFQSKRKARYDGILGRARKGCEYAGRA